MKQAILYSTVAETAHQRGNYWIQEQYMGYHCVCRNIDIAGKYRDNAKLPVLSRPGFRHLLTHIRQEEENIHYLLINTWSNLSNDIDEIACIMEEMQNCGVQIIATEQSYAIPENFSPEYAKKSIQLLLTHEPKIIEADICRFGIHKDLLPEFTALISEGQMITNKIEGWQGDNISVQVTYNTRDAKHLAYIRKMEKVEKRSRVAA